MLTQIKWEDALELCNGKRARLNAAQVVRLRKHKGDLECWLDGVMNLVVPSDLQCPAGEALKGRLVVYVDEFGRIIMQAATGPVTVELSPATAWSDSLREHWGTSDPLSMLLEASGRDRLNADNLTTMSAIIKLALWPQEFAEAMKEVLRG